MGLFRFSNSDAVAEYKSAKAAQNANQRAEKAAGIREETDTYRELNAKTNEAAAKVSWFRR